MKGKLGRLLGVFEVSILRKLAEQSAPMTGETALKRVFYESVVGLCFSLSQKTANDATFGKAILPTANFYNFCFVM